jgi:IS5 family transposase
MDAIKVLDKKPEQVVFDGGFSSRDNLEQIKGLGIRDIAFSKAPGMSRARNGRFSVLV